MNKSILVVIGWSKSAQREKGGTKLIELEQI